MKRCPTCNRTFTDPNLSFCLDDGTPLARVDTPADEATVVSSAAEESGRGWSGDQSYVPGSVNSPAYQPPGSYAPPSQASKRRAWPWVVAVLAVVLILLAGLGIAAAIIIPNLIRASSDRKTANSNDDRGRNYESNLNANTANESEGANESERGETTPAPTDEAQILEDLTELEHEWTVANINADKKKLDRILGDDYVGTSPDGTSQGKAEYLRTIERDTSIQRWDFEDLKVSLKGDRASLTGILRLKVNNQEVAYRFTDKFVWRDGRWQAIGSEVTQVK